MSRKISHYSNSSPSSFENVKRYTVQRTESSLSTVSNKEENNQFYNVSLCVLKWLTALFLFAAVLFCVVTSKICLLVLGHQFRSTNQTGNSVTGKTASETSKQALFLMLLLALMIPQAVSFIYASWTSLRRKSRPWPSKQGIILILIGGALETISLCYITIVMLTVVPISPDAIILLMCSLPVASAIWQAIKSRSRWRTATGKLEVIKFGTCAVLAMVGIGLLASKVPDISGQIAIPVVFILLSIAWTPKMRKIQIQRKEPSSNVNMSTSHISEFSTYSGMRDGNIESSSLKRKSARGKAAIVSSLWKLILTPFVAVAFSEIYHIIELGNISEGFKAINVLNPSFVYFMLHIFTSLFGYHFGWLACSLCMQHIGYALPLTLATPIAVMVTHVKGICETNTVPLPCRSENQIYTLAAGSLLWLAQFLATTYYVWKSPGLIMAKAHDLLWLPSYNGVCLEQYLLLNRRNKASDEDHDTQQKLSHDVNVFICTTMYHEEDYEMEQLLRSIHDVDENCQKNGRHFESHVFFDGCVTIEVLNSYVLKLASLVERTLKVHLADCIKMKTSYGMQLKWKLSGGMDFTIHLKDNSKVKNKKRWSQVMYMSYVLDYKEAHLGVSDEQSFILTTDADVKFTYESVEALIDQIMEDPRTGAVCARTHPMGSGPVVWYQIFDYAIGHWFQKVANHMFGSVLCSPGCFSLYRCQAVRDVLPTYATRVNHASEFLTKDMGEDRWMCTLMVQQGWRLGYCAAAEDRTYCPESFDEFYKQRRRWTPSTLANLVLLVSQWKLILKNNEYISFLFILYQTFLVCSTVIGPSTVILVIVGGMLYSGIGLDEVAIVLLISLLVVGYTFVCLFTSQTFQLKVSKLLTFVFAVIMCIVVIGVAVQIKNELNERNVEPTAAPTVQPNTTATTLPKSLEHHLPAGISTLYLAGLSGIFIAAGLLHPKEFTCIFHGVWYLLCLPSGYLLLTIYSLCNLTDRSWGTREGKTASGDDDWYKPLVTLWKKMCKCFQDEGESSQLRHAANMQSERGSIVESRTSIKTEVINSNQNGSKDALSFTAQGEVCIKTETTEVLRLQSDENHDSNEVDERKRPITTIHKTLSENVVLGRPQDNQDNARDDDNVEVTNGNYEFPTIVVSSAHDISKKDNTTKRLEPTDRAKIGEGSKDKPLPDKWNSLPRKNSSLVQNVESNDEAQETVESRPNSSEEGDKGTSNEQNGPEHRPTIRSENKRTVTTSLADSSRWSGGVQSKQNQKLPHLESSTASQCIDLKNEVSQEASMGSNTAARVSNSAFSSSITSEIGLSTLPTVAKEPVGPSPIHKQTTSGNSIPPTLSSLIKSSASILSDSPSEEGPESHMKTNLELSSKFGSSVSLRTLDEKGCPMTVLKTEVSISDLKLPVEDWLPREYKHYAPKFQENGYDTAGFLPGMNDKDLQVIGIVTRGHRQKLLREIRKIPRIDIEEDIPENVESWLEELGLGRYWPKFESSGYTEASDLEDLKNMSQDSLKDTFNIRKQGHLNKLISAIRKLQYPNQGQLKVRQTRRELDRLPLYYLDVDNNDDGIEYEFWEGLRQTCLLPELSGFDQTSELKEKLVELRNTSLLIFGVANVLWMIIILTLVRQKDLKVLGVDIIGLGFLTIYGFIFVLQFLGLLGHRFKTIVHILARTPWRLSNKVGTSRVSDSESISSPQTPRQ